MFDYMASEHAQFCQENPSATWHFYISWSLFESVVMEVNEAEREAITASTTGSKWQISLRDVLESTTKSDLGRKKYQ